jgi:hypothetical protein
MSNYNPFRTQIATPNPTGASASSTVPPSYTSTPPPSFSESGPPSYSDDDDEESPEALPDLTPRIPSGRPSQLISQNTGSSYSTPPSLPPRPSSSSSGPPLPSNRPQTDDVLLSTDGIPESAPPAYSVTPNVGGGELVVEQGPRRPFQRAPEPILQLSTPSQQQQEAQRQHLQPPQPEPPQFGPPPGPPPSRPGRPNSQLSDFAQDFYNSRPAGQQQSQQPRYAPPSGPPPPPRRPRAASTSSGAGSTAPPSSDGRPTTTPTPGHPLLRNGKTLVYPENYLCQKCTFCTPCPPYCSLTFYRAKPRKGQNTGYKNFDPSHPCRKCWDRFSKPFTAALASSPWGNQASGSASQNGRSFQRPLPAYKPPQAQARAPPPPAMPAMPGTYTPDSPSGMQCPNSRPMPTPFRGVPPPGSTVVMPGDPRIGGRVCWQCGGRGTTPFLIFDEITCETCGGIGRLVN